jgi:Tol biopolymer transport system component
VFLVAAALAHFVLRRQGASSPRLVNPVAVAASVGLESSPDWSPDGRTLAYMSNQDGDFDVWMKLVDGGPAVNRTADHKGLDAQPRWSPDGRQVAFWSRREGGGVFVMSPLGGEARKVASATHPSWPYPHPPAWSPDSSELAYLVALGLPDYQRLALERRNLRDGTTKQVELPGTKGNMRLDVAWSPDGRWLAYVDGASYRTTSPTQLRLLRWSDGHATAITDGRWLDWRPSWAPDSRALYFASNRGGTMDVWRLRVNDDGTATAPERLTTGLEVQAATLSSDGRRLAYVKGRSVGNVWRVPILAERPATWADAEQLTFDQALVNQIDVTRDGQRLVIKSDRSGADDLWIMPAKGGDPQLLPGGPPPRRAPDWSPDDREIAFASPRGISIQPVAGGPARQLTNGGLPRWSPDGRALAYAGPRPAYGLWVVPAAGGEARQVVDDPFAADVSDWSPDGEWLAFVSERSGESRIWRVRSTGGEAEPMSTRSYDRLPRWSPDGKWIYFRSGRDGGPSDPQLWGVSVTKKVERAFTNFSGKRGVIDPHALATDGKYLYFSWHEDLADIWVMDVVPR